MICWQVSALGKKYASHVYKHFQMGDGGAEPLAHDDFHSPVHPQLYIELRIQPSIDFYQTRIPSYANQRYMLRFAVLFCCMTATLSAWSYSPRSTIAVVGVTSLSAAITSWTEVSSMPTVVHKP